MVQIGPSGSGSQTISPRRTEATFSTIGQAQDRAREQAHIGKPTNDLSIKARVEHYMSDLQIRGRDVRNGSRVLFHLAGTKLANKPVTASSLADDLNEFRDHLAAEGLKPSTIDRINCVIKAALNLTAENDERVTKRPWKTALKATGSIERNCSRFIGDHVDEMVRATLPKPAEVAAIGGPQAHRHRPLGLA